MSSGQVDSSFADDGLRISEDTEASEVKAFLRRRAEDPHHIEDSVIYNFSSYDVDSDALEYAVEEKLQGGKYLIPYQVTGTWGFMYHMLPHSIKEAEILVYHPQDSEYYAYQNFYPDVPQEVQEEFRHQLSRIADDGE